MTQPADDKFFAAFGKFVCVLSFVFVLVCAIVGVGLIYAVDHSYRTDTTPLAAPDTTRKVTK